MAQQSLQRAFALHQAGRLSEAEALYGEILREVPKHPDALHLMGLLARQRGDNEAAVEWIKRAAAYHPAAPLFSNLGNACLSLGRLDEAIDSFRKALQCAPNHVPALNNLGIAYQQQGKLAEAIDCFRNGLAIQPDFAELYSNLGDALRENQQFDVAIEFIEQAIVLKPEFAMAHFNLGKAFRDDGRAKMARASLMKAEELDPAHVDTQLALAELDVSEGCFETAQARIDRVLREVPDHPDAWALIPSTKKMSQDDEAWAGKAKVLLKAGLKPKEALGLDYALGKYFDDVGLYGDAFSHYARANQRQGAMRPSFDWVAHGERVDAIIAANGVASVRSRNGAASDSRRPIFIVGMPRSGTSLLEQMLASHQDVFGAGELGYWGRVATENWPLHPAWKEDGDLIRRIAQEYEAELLRHSTDALHVIDKMPGNFFHLGWIYAAFPDARIIHMRRNPIDTCLSIYFQSFSEGHPYANSLDDLAKYYRDYLRLMSHWREALPATAFCDVSYEALVEEPEGQLRRILEFVGLNWQDACLDFHRTERRVGTASNWQVRQRIYKTSRARWLNYQQFVDVLLPLLDESNGKAA